MTKAKEVNFDGLVGPTHNYSGLSFGNVASFNNANTISNPKLAALQGLEKMKFLLDLGLTQVVMPPPIRPYINLLKNLGFTGSLEDILKKVKNTNPELLSAVYSASSMWTANAATVSPSFDTLDKKVHITPANLASKFHRSLENPYTTKLLRAIFKDDTYFEVHDPLYTCHTLADEGAANHNRFCSNYGDAAVELFVYGRYGFDQSLSPSKIYPARQSDVASKTIARLHKLDPKKVLFVQQSIEAIDAGVFHNDVISVANKNVFFFHEKAFVNTQDVIEKLNQMIPKFTPLRVSSSELEVKQAVCSYIFNSQIITKPSQEMCIIAPRECYEINDTKIIFDNIIKDNNNPITSVHYFNLHESMKNGGGPACLRLRVVLSEEELNAIHQGVILTEDLYIKLKDWILKHYRDVLSPADFIDPYLYRESEAAFHELMHLLNLSSYHLMD